MNYIYFKNTVGDVFAYESQAEREMFGSSDLVEMTPEQVNSHITPGVTYQQALLNINTEYQKDVDTFNKSFSLAIMFGGPTEEAKKANIRTLYAASKTKYAADLVALRTQYGV